MQSIICMSNTLPIQQHKVIVLRIEIQQGHKSDVLKENVKHLTTSTKLQSMGTHQNTKYKLKYINQSTESFKQQA